MAENFFTKEQGISILWWYDGPVQMAVSGYSYDRVADALRAAGREDEVPVYEALSAQYDVKPAPLAYEDRFSE